MQHIAEDAYAEISTYYATVRKTRETCHIWDKNWKKDDEIHYTCETLPIKRGRQGAKDISEN